MMDARIWVSPQRIMLSEKRLTPKGHVLCYFIYVTFFNDKVLEIEMRLMPVTG